MIILCNYMVQFHYKGYLPPQEIQHQQWLRFFYIRSQVIMSNYLKDIFDKLSLIDNNFIFIISIIPYSIFLFYLYKNPKISKTIKVGFTLTLLFVFITIIFSIISLVVYDKSLVEIDSFHGFAEAFLTITDFVILLGFINLLKKIEVKNS